LTSSVWRGQQHSFVVGLFLGALTSGLLVGAAGGMLSWLPVVPRLVALAALVAVISGFELAGRPLNLPQNRRLVPQTVIPQARVSGPLQFGFEMGTGVRTYVPTALPHALVASVLLAGGLVPGLLAGVGFGIGRALMPVIRSRHPQPQEWDGDLLRRMHTVGRWCAGGFLLAAVSLVVLLAMSAR
jgi:hypothetical protein